MTRRLLFSACLLALVLTFIATRYSLMNAAPDPAPPPDRWLPPDQSGARLASLTGPTQYTLAAQHYVAVTGADSGNCTNASAPCRTVQYAVDRAAGGDEILVATGVYTNQAVYLNKTVTIRGGYATGNWTTSDPAANPTTLDAHGQGPGPVLYITGNISPTIESLRLTGGSGYGGSYGGGVYVVDAAATISKCWVFDNSAALGGGLYLSSGASTLDGNTIISNTANQGGGLYLYSGAITLKGNLISSNSATLDGGGMYLQTSDAALVNNVVADNQANRSGSGLYVYSAAPRLLHTTIAHNTNGDGSGIHIANYSSLYSTVSLTNTILVSHTVGVTVTAGNTATLKGVLWYSNSIAAGGAGNIAVTNAYTGDSAFAADGYHLTAASAAIDQGINSRATADIDRDARPQGGGYDLGADEYLGARGIIDPGLGGAIIYTSSQGLTTTVQVPPNAVTTTISLVYTLIVSPTEPVSPDLRFVGQAFDLDAYRNGQRLVGFTFTESVTVTIHYSQADVDRVAEETVALYRWVETGWQRVGERPGESQKLDSIKNEVKAWLLGLTRFHDMGVAAYPVFLPVVCKTG